VDPHRVDANPDSTYHSDADPDSHFLLNADPDLTVHTDADPDPDPSFKKKAQTLEKCKIGSYSIHFGSTSAN
jgi:hypothetical protein